MCVGGVKRNDHANNITIKNMHNFKIKEDEQGNDIYTCDCGEIRVVKWSPYASTTLTSEFYQGCTK